MNDLFEPLKIFCSLAETLQFKETANRLAVSPSVVARIISEFRRTTFSTQHYTG